MHAILMVTTEHTLISCLDSWLLLSVTPETPDTQIAE